MTWCRLSGESDQKSHAAAGLRMLVFGWRFCVWMKSGNLSGSRTKKTGVLLPTRSPVALLGVEFQREAAHVALRVGRAALARHGGETQQHRRLLAHLREEARFGVARDVVRDGKRAIRAGALGVHGPFRHALAVLVRQLLEQLVILEQKRTARTGGKGVLVVGNRIAAGGRQFGSWWKLTPSFNHD